MANSQFIASIHNDYLPFVAIASDSELAQFVRAQIAQAAGEEIPELAGMAKALFDAHNALLERLGEASRKKSEAGRRGGNPALKQAEREDKQAEPVLNQCLTTGKAEDKPVSISDTVTEPKKKESKKGAAVVSAKRPQDGYAGIIDGFTGNEALKETLWEFIRMRVKKRAPPTDRALELVLKHLRGLSTDERVQIAVLEQSIVKGWTDVYPLKDDENAAGADSRYEGVIL